MAEAAAGRDKITDATAALFADSAKIPERFIRTNEVQAAGTVVVGEGEASSELPVVDMARLLDPELSAQETAKLGSACREWGFFQVRIGWISRFPQPSPTFPSSHQFCCLIMYSSRSVQLVNHGVDEEATQQIKDSVAQFFSLPLEAKNTATARARACPCTTTHRAGTGTRWWASRRTPTPWA